MSTELPPLPVPDIWVREDFGLGDTATHIGFSEDQMHAYARAAIAAEREACAAVVEHHNPGGSYHIRTELAKAIRARATMETHASST